MSAECKHRRAVFFLGKIDEILSWEKTKSRRKTPGLSNLEIISVKSGLSNTAYWRLKNLRSFEEFLEKRFPDSSREAYYCT